MNFEFSSRIRARRAAGCWRECYSMPSRSHRAAIDRPRRRGHRVRRRELMFLLGGEMTAARALRAQQKAMPVGLLSPRWPRPARFTVYGRVPPRAKRNRLRRGTKPGDRIPVSGGPLRSTARIGADDEGAGPPRGKCRLVEVEEKIPGRHGLTAGGNRIRTIGPAEKETAVRERPRGRPSSSRETTCAICRFASRNPERRSPWPNRLRSPKLRHSQR
jgi:hypothetical protein